jgi:hypothetical protein
MEDEMGKMVVSTMAVAALAAACLSCAGDQKGSKTSDEEAWPDSEAPEAPEDSLAPASGGGGDACMQANGEPLPCSSNEDCCSGYSCGFDPERSRVQRYCMQE